MGIFEKRRFRKFLQFVQEFDEKDAKTWRDFKPGCIMKDVYASFSLDENTQSFTGHALALYRDDELVVVTICSLYVLRICGKFNCIFTWHVQMI